MKTLKKEQTIMDQYEVQRKIYSALGAIDVFLIMQEDLFDEIKLADPMSFPVDALGNGLTDIKEKMRQINSILPTNTPKSNSIHSAIVELNPIAKILKKYFDVTDLTDLYIDEDWTWELLQNKIVNILEQAHKNLLLLSNQSKGIITEYKYKNN